MATNCKLIIGYTDHTNWWNETQAFYRHYDGYTEAIIPLLKKFVTAEKGVDIEAMNDAMEYDGNKWEELENSYDGVTRPDYIYYIDESDRGEIKCTVLEDSLDFSKHYGISNYNVKMELILND